MNAVKQPTRIRAGQTGGVVRRVDDLGRIVIPVEIRRRFGIEIRDPLEISVRGEAKEEHRSHVGREVAEEPRHDEEGNDDDGDGRDEPGVRGEVTLETEQHRQALVDEAHLVDGQVGDPQREHDPAAAFLRVRRYGG